MWSILASMAITLAKGAAGLATGSLALISDAAHSLLDVAATTITWLAVRAAGKPADEEHQYGHGKFESLAALIETAFLFVLSGAVAYEGVRRLSTGQSDVRPSWAAAGRARRRHRHRCLAVVVAEARRAGDRQRGLGGGRAAFLVRPRQFRPRPRRARRRRMRAIRRPMRSSPSAYRCSSPWPASGWRSAPSTPCSTRRRRASPSRSAPAPRGCRASSSVERVRVRPAGGQRVRRGDGAGVAHPAARARRRDQGQGRGGDPRGAAAGRVHGHGRSGPARRRDHPRAGAPDRRRGCACRSTTSPCRTWRGACR